MKILVTGGAGYIGSIATEQLVEIGHRVVVMDNLSMGHRAAVHNGADFVQGDLSDRSKIDEVMAAHQPEAVMHFASKTLVGESMSHPFLYLGDNVINAINLLESMMQHGVGKIILSSTANLFDDPKQIPIAESEKIVPGSPYGESKNIIERMLKWLEVTNSLQYACLRYFNAAGAGEGRGEDHTPETHIIPLILQVALGQREAFSIFGEDYATPDGTCVRDYIHVLDLAQAHILALEALDAGSRVYNLGNGSGFSVKQVVDAAREVTGKEIKTQSGDRRPGDPDILVADSRKIQADLGWHPKFGDLHTIVETAWRWHSSKPRGYSS
ncbi:MAG: UDP-glucose 4-epimerase GalE [Verrucomicrobiota bacterium]